ncbi:hypothetical protein [uncultured Thiodictyon sp.]|jgi:hypothetical protein|uniref:hypothetical protein n=1 Tax=uncultured Thiodictyon sp. TaxID=1846217 RepID=UPI0025D6D863|nr:hypothetical protein [uncultured Thiodictyon sp.]
MNRYRFLVTLRVQGPVISRAVQAGQAGIDAVVLRDRHQLEALPGTLIRGLLRDAWAGFGWDQSIRDWLGGDPVAAREPGKHTEAYGLRPARVRFADHWTVANRGRARSYRHRIRIEDTGAVSGGGLMLIESPFAAGEIVTFTGLVSAEADGQASVDDLRRRIRQGLRWVPAVGGLKGVGFGRLLDAEVAAAEHLPSRQPTVSRTPAAAPAAPAAPATLSLGLRIACDDELCFPRPGPKGTLGNRYVTDDIIPGAAIKAVLARLWSTQDALRDPYLDALRVTHALPVQGREQRPLAIPLSLAFADGRGSAAIHLRDLALTAEPELLAGTTPRFAPDWKTGQRRIAAATCGWDAPPQRRVRVRNAIDRTTGTVRFDPVNDSGYLFALETLLPQGHRWLANLQVPEVQPEDRDRLIATLTELLSQELAPLGKTKACAWVETLRIGAPWAFAAAGGPLIRDDGRVLIDLQTPALLLPPDFTCAPTNDGATLQRAYQAAWDALSHGSLTLSHFYASQALGGGIYWWNHFRRKEQPYRPVVLTQLGSVFALRVVAGQQSAAASHLARWRDHGLPPPHGFDPDWRRNPWLAQNGYGEVAINPDLHWTLAPTAEDDHA